MKTGRQVSPVKHLPGGVPPDLDVTVEQERLVVRKLLLQWSEISGQEYRKHLLHEQTQTRPGDTLPSINIVTIAGNKGRVSSEMVNKFKVI